jgi:hypothetical protein
MDARSIAQGWIEVQRNWWAYEALLERCEFEPEGAWDVIVALAALCDSDELVEDLGAGPLEDFIRHHAPNYVDPLEALAKRSPPFGAALGHVRLPISTDPISTRLFALGVQGITATRAPWQAA